MPAWYSVRFPMNLKTYAAVYRIATQCSTTPICHKRNCENQIFRKKAKRELKFLSKYLNSKKFFYIVSRQLLSRLTVKFMDSHILTSKREELHGQTEFIANCGGFLGLFLGVSFLSFVELAYFCTIRLWVDIFRERNQRNC
jgi:Amiloride-sensitive sodium channel